METTIQTKKTAENGKQETELKQKITPFLWFDRQAEEAANFYTSVFKNSRVVSVTRYDEKSAQASGLPKDSVMTAEFELEGQRFVALNGGPHFKFTEAVSFVINCETQEEVDELSWQVVPTILPELFRIKDPEKSKRVTQAMLQMKKIDIEALKKAAE